MRTHSRETLNLGQRLARAVEIETAFTIHIGPLAIPVTETVVVSWGVMAVLILAAWLCVRRLREVPTGAQNAAEWFVSLINDFAKQNLGHHWWAFSPYLGTIALYIFASSIVSFVSPMGGFGLEPPFVIKPPTRDINVTAALALMTMALVFYAYLSRQGLKGWLASLFRPVPAMLPFNLLEYLIKPMSLALRLFGNILGAFIIMELISLSAPLVIPPVAGLYFDLLDGLIQTAVFVMLTTLYLAEAVKKHSTE